MDTQPHFILRYTLVPDENKDIRIGELVDFCSKTEIPEVAFFINAEEFNDGH